MLVRNFSTTSSGACGRRASAPSSPPRTGAPGSPTFPRSPQHGPAVPTTRLPSQHGHSERRGGGVGIDLALRAPRLGPCTQTRTGRSPLPGRRASTRPSRRRGPEKTRTAKAHSTNVDELFPVPSTAAVPRAPGSSVRRRCGDALRARPSSGGGHRMWLVRVELPCACFGLSALGVPNSRPRDTPPSGRSSPVGPERSPDSAVSFRMVEARREPRRSAAGVPGVRCGHERGTLWRRPTSKPSTWPTTAGW
jgi:hypothetical protein